MASDTGNQLLTPDFVSYPAKPGIVSAQIIDNTVQVTWGDGAADRFHHFWLRDHCPCRTCVNPVTREQVFEIDSVPLSVTPAEVGTTELGGLSIVWADDGHVSHYHPGWLRENRYFDVPTAPAKRRQTTWGGNFEIPSHDANAVLTDDKALYAWLSDLHEYGTAFLRNLPLEEGMVGKVAERISFMRQTNFGVIFDVQSLPETNTNANTSLELPPHTDLPTREQEPGLQFLHCMTNDAEGGASVLVDGFRLGEAIRNRSPEMFAALTQLKIEWRNTDRDTDYRCAAPVIGLDEDGDFWEVRFGNFLKGPLRVPADRMEGLYRAYRAFTQESKKPEHQVTFSLQPGDLMAFDNRRVLHGRTEFFPETGARRLQGCYLDRDELLSRLRVLERPRA